jgi:hypothetical protein
MQKIYSNVVPMIAGVRRGLRAASIFVLGLALSIIPSAPAFASTTPTHRVGSSAAYTTVLAPALRSHALPHTCAPATCRSIAFRLLPRAFAEDAPPPPSETLDRARLQLPFKPSPVPRPIAPARTPDVFSVCIRQRAP